MEFSLKNVSVTTEQFNDLCKEAFNLQKVNAIPAHVFYLMDREKEIAFCSVSMHSPGNLMLEICGFMTGVEQGKKYGYYIKMLDALHKMGFLYIMGEISNRNKIALMWALRAGFMINGVRQSTNGQLFVEVLHTFNIGDTVSSGGVG